MMMSDYYDLRPEYLVCECGWLARRRLGGDVLLRVEGSCCVGSFISLTHDAVLTPPFPFASLRNGFPPPFRYHTYKDHELVAVESTTQ
jgi:hypothetical protein